MDLYARSKRDLSGHDNTVIGPDFYPVDGKNIDKPSSTYFGSVSSIAKTNPEGGNRWLGCGLFLGAPECP